MKEVNVIGISAWCKIEHEMHHYKAQFQRMYFYLYAIKICAMGNAIFYVYSCIFSTFLDGVRLPKQILFYWSIIVIFKEKIQQ